MHTNYIVLITNLSHGLLIICVQKLTGDSERGQKERVVALFKEG